MTAEERSGLGPRLAWHAGIAWRTSRVAMVVALLASGAMGYLLPVQDGWIAGAVAGGAALLAILILALGARGAPPPPPQVPDPGAALERARTADLWAHALARSAFMLASVALGLALGGLFTRLAGT